MYKVLIPQDVPESGKAYLRERGYELVMGSGFDSETIKREIADADAVIARTALYPADVIRAGKKLKIISRHGIGVDNIDVKAAEEAGIYVTVTKNQHTSYAVAEHAMTMMMVLAIVLSMVVCTLLGVTVERIAYRPLREAPSLAVLITAIGVSYLLQQVAQLAWTSNPKSFTSVVAGLKPISLFDGQLTISVETVVTIIACVVIMAVLIWFVNNTPAGHAMLAVSEDRGAAQLMGVNVNATISLTFAIGSALAAVAGALLCSSYPTL